MTPKPPNIRRRRFVLALGISLAFHVLLVAYLAWSHLHQPPPAVAGQEPYSPYRAPSSWPTDTSQITAEMVAKHIERGLPVMASLSPSEKVARLDDSADRLEKISSPESMDEIGALVRKAIPTRTRAYRPAENPPAGPFDTESAIFHSVRRFKDQTGQEQAVFVLLDSAGRTLEAPVTDDDRYVAATIERMHGSETLRRLYEGIFMPIMDAKVVEARKKENQTLLQAAPAATEP